MKTNQDRVIDYIKQFGSITTIEAFRDLGNTRLSASIYELKKKGYNFKVMEEKSKNRFGASTSYSRYYLIWKEN